MYDVVIRTKAEGYLAFKFRVKHDDLLDNKVYQYCLERPEKYSIQLIPIFA